MLKKKGPKKVKSKTASMLLPTFSAVLTVLLAFTLFGDKRNNVADASQAPVQVVTKDDTVLLPTPARAITRGEKLSNVPMASTPWPKSKVDKEFIKNASPYRDFVVTYSLPARMPIPLTALRQGQGMENAVVGRIPPGMRAITVRVDEESAVEGWARSGSFVDVIAIRPSGGKNSALESKVIAENVKIISAGRSTEPVGAEASAPKAPKTVTLLVTQKDALRIKTAASVGKLTFSLRGIGDDTPTVARQTNHKAVFGIGDGEEAEALNYHGVARGPDGKVYLLAENNRWVKKSSSVSLEHESSSLLSEGK